MVKASALYLVIVIALVISIICSSLIMAAYIYKERYNGKFRTDRLQNNTTSGINILLTSKDDIYSNGRTFSLFGNDEDSVTLKRSFWGAYDICTVSAFIQKDTVNKVFTMTNTIDSAKWAAVYLPDNYRPLSLSGNTKIRGDGYLPKAGVKPAYADNQSYKGDLRLILGKQYASERSLPPLSSTRLTQFYNFIRHQHENDLGLLNEDTSTRSFLQSTQTANFGKKVTTLSHLNLSGNIVLYSDTTLVIDSTTVLNNVMVFAKSIEVKNGFKGSCQLYASDSVSVGRNCHFSYPSCLGVLRFDTTSSEVPERIHLGENSSCDGLLFSYHKAPKQLPGIIILEKKVKVQGQIYAQGFLSLQAGVIINGSVFTDRFLYQNGFTSYENYLINVTIDSQALSKYYLGSDLLPAAGEQKKNTAMAGSKITLSARVQGSTIQEVVVSMVIIMVVFGIAMVIFANVIKFSLSAKKIRAEAMLEEMLIKAGQTESNSDNSITVDDLKIEQVVKPVDNEDGLEEIQLTAFDTNGQQVAQVRQIIITSHEIQN